MKILNILTQNIKRYFDTMNHLLTPACPVSSFLFFFFTSLLEYKCFTVLCQFLLYNKVNQVYVYIYPHIPSLVHLPPTLLIPSFQVVTKHRVDPLVLCSSLPLAIHFTFGNVYMSMLLSHFIPASLSPTVPSSLFSMSVFLLLPCHQVHRYHFLKLHIYALAYSICFSLIYFTLYDCLQVHPRLYK